MRQEVQLGTNWYDDVLPYPMPVCVITSRDQKGRVNVGAYSLVFPWSGLERKPQVVVLSRQNTRTANNIRATGEFVLNYIPQDYLRDVVAVGRSYPLEQDKVALTRFTLIPAAKVQVPCIQEAIFHLECVLDQVIYPTPAQSNLIGTIVYAAMEERLLRMKKEKRLQEAGLAVFFGYEEGHYFFCPPKKPRVLPARPELAETASLPPLPWEAEAEEILKQVPALFRGNVRRAIEKRLREEGKTLVTAEDLRRIRRETGME